MDDWRFMQATALGEAIGEGKIDPVDLTETFLSAIDAHQHASRIYARTTAVRARAEAQAASKRARAGTRRGLLDGVPISWKDLYDSAGTATEAGSRLLAGRVPDRDARVLANASDAGLVCLGKTHMTELAFSGLGLNPNTATPPNVNDPGAAPGGSSSGAAASVAFGLAAAAIGSDTGGSVRAPAAWNDLVGLKTRHGRLSLEGVVPLCPRFDTIGPLCRSVGDAMHLLAAMEGRSAAAVHPADPSRLRLGLLNTVAMDDLETTIDEATAAAVARIEAAGIDVERIDVPAVARAMPLSAKLYAPEAYATWRTRIEDDAGAMYPPVRERFRAGRDVSAPDYIAAWAELDGLRRDYARATAHLDAVLLPTVAILPPQVARLEADAEHFAERNLMTLRNTRIGNLMGLAGVTLPTGTSSVGLLLQGPSEERLLSVAATLVPALS